MIARVYGQLGRINPSPVVELNRAVAVGMAQGPDAGLALLDALVADGALAGYHLLPAARADLLRRLGRQAEAADAYAAGARPRRHRRRAALPDPPPGRGARGGRALAGSLFDGEDDRLAGRGLTPIPALDQGDGGGDRPQHGVGVEPSG